MLRARRTRSPPARLAGSAGKARRPRGPSGPRRSDRRIRLMLACVCVAICRARPCARCRCRCSTAARSRRAAEAQQRVHGAAVGAARPDRRPHGPAARALVPGRHRRVLALAHPRSHAPSRRRSRTYATITPAEIEKRMGGSAQYVFVARRLDPSTWTRIKADPDARPARQVAGDRAASRSRGASTPTAAWPRRSSAVDGDGLSGVELSRNDVLSARDGLALGLEGQRPADRRPHWARVLHVREPAPGKTVQLTLDTRIQRLVQQAIAATRAKWHAKAVTAVVLDTRTGGILAMAAAPGVPPAGLPRRQSRGVAPARDHRPLRAGLDVQARDLHGRAAGGRDHCPSTPFRVPDTYTKTFEHPPSRARSRTRTPHAVEDWTAREILAHSSNVGTITIAEQRLGQTRLQQVDQRRSASASRRASTCRASSPAVVLPDDKWYGTAHPQRPDRRGHRRHAAADGGALRLGRQRRHVDPAARHRGHRRQADHGLDASASWCRRTWPGSCAACSPTSSTTAPARWRTSRATAWPARPARRRSSTPSTARYCDPYKGQCEYQTSFVGFAPAKHPRFVALVMVDEPHVDDDQYDLEGGYVAAPAFKRIAQGILQVLADPARPTRREL